MTEALPPWHMWGSTQTVRITPVGGTTVERSLQIARINYRRPDVWRFFVAGSVVGAGIASDQITVRMYFDLILGVGRSVFDTSTELLSTNTQWVPLIWTLPALQNLAAIDKKWTTETSTPSLSTGVVQLMRWFPAQDVQCKARVQVTSETTEPELTLEATAFFAPSTHLRPDWFSGRFQGEERGGT